MFQNEKVAKMSSEVDAMSADYVRQLRTDELCQWLNARINKDDWKDTELVI
jgi:hypothetical protein